MLLAKYQEPVYWHIRRLVVSHDDAQDASQETFVRIFRSLHQYKGDCSFRSWIYRIATNEALRIIALALITSVLTLQAQVSKKQRISREQLAEKQAQHIAHDLALDDATTAKFVATYHEYQKELWAIGPRPKRARAMRRAKNRQRRRCSSSSHAASASSTFARNTTRSTALSLRSARYSAFTK